MHWQLQAALTSKYTTLVSLYEEFNEKELLDPEEDNNGDNEQENQENAEAEGALPAPAAE